jgi:hypothetical protein
MGKRTSQCLLIEVYRDSTIVCTFTMRQWELFIRQSRAANVLPRMASILARSDNWQNIPESIQHHLRSAITTSDALARAMKWEVYNIVRAIGDLNVPFVFLKGVAYLIADLPAKEGRVFSDVDFMVAKSNIAQVEKALLAFGWVSTHLNKYDQRYYRQWMHEIPPLKHTIRKSVLDVHHAILPESARLQTDSKKLLESSVTVNKPFEACRVLSPIDMILHSATHLFCDGEYDHGMRDLMDMDLLFKNFGKKESFWQALIPRATELNLSLPLYYAVRYSSKILNTPIPQNIVTQLDTLQAGRWQNTLMDKLLIPALQPDHKSCAVPFIGIIRWMLYIRGHYLRMPLHLLIPHLIRKSFAKDD